MEIREIKVSDKFKNLVKEASFTEADVNEMLGYIKVMRPKEYFFVNPPLALEQSIERLKTLQNSKDEQLRKKAECIKQLLKDNKYYTKFENLSIKRDPEEIKSIFTYNVKMLDLLCKEFDKGKTEAALWIAVILRTLIHTHYDEKEKRYSSLSIIDQMDKKIVVYLSSAFPKPETDNFLQGWSMENISNTNFSSVSIYAGLLIKTLTTNKKGEYIAEFKAMKDMHPEKNRYIVLSEWLNEIIFQDSKKTLTRWDAIKMVANKDGGAHLDPNVPPRYDAFRSKNLFKIRCNNKTVMCSSNPVYVSIRQIAWEVLETFKHNHLI